MIRQARKNDIDAIEEVYRARVQYNDTHNAHQWRAEDVTWGALSKTYTLQDFYVVEKDDVICAVCCIVDEDPMYWHDIAPKTSLFLHKICVHPKYAKQGYSDALLIFFKQMGKERGYPLVRLDVRSHKQKLRQLYERHDFVLVREETLFEGFITALYACKI